MRLTIRPMKPRSPDWTPDSLPDDRSFVVESWISSYRHRPALVGFHDWHGVMTLAVGRIIALPGVKVIMATDADAEPGIADLLGWMAYEPRAVTRAYNDETRRWEYRRVPSADRTPADEPLCWYVYTKATYRKNGVARRLFRHAGIDPRGRFHYVCDTNAVDALRSAGKIPRATLRLGLGRIDERGPHGQRSEDHDSDAA